MHWRRVGRRRLALGLLGPALVLAGCLGFALSGPTTAAPTRSTPPSQSGLTAEKVPVPGNQGGAVGATPQNLPPATAAPVAAPAAVATVPPLAAREDFAFAPYWTLPQSGGFGLSGLSTLDYFAVGVNANGTLEESGPGWNGYESQALSDLITRAHAGGARVVLTVNDFDQSSLNVLTSSSTAPATLAAELMPVLRAKNLDGVNFDFEGQGSQDQAGLTNLVSVVSGALRGADSHWQITMDTYASSAGDPGGFYDIAALAPSVDAFFVMAYELNLSATPSTASPLTSGMFGDLSTLEQYTAVVPAAKVILGVPFFGIDWPTTNGTLGAEATGAAAELPDSQVQNGGDPPYWDPVTDTGWTSYQVGDQWHESYYEDPQSLFDVAQLAARFRLRGVGIWALGMEDDDTQMIAALDGFAPAGGVGSTGPRSTSPSPTTSAPPPLVAASLPAGGASQSALPTGSIVTASPLAPASPSASSSDSSTTTTSTTTPPTSTTSTTTSISTPVAAPSITGTFDGTTRTLTAVSASAVNSLLSLGELTDFATTDPAYACLTYGPPLTVYPDGLLSGYDVAVATTPTECTSEDFTFPS